MTASTSSCRSCGAPMLWVRTPAGRPMPLDPEPSEDGNVEIVDGLAVVHHQPPLDHGDLYTPHFATCPDGATWSRR